jgi:predicted protein tyrosine phosphatase
MRLLFLCSRNQWRSPTAEKVYQNDARVEVRSAGLSASARCRVSEKLLRWADRVMVMEHAHKRRLGEQFPEVVRDLRIEDVGHPRRLRIHESGAGGSDPGARGAAAVAYRQTHFDEGSGVPFVGG